MSERYVRSLARDSQNVVDGPYAGRLTGYGEFSMYYLLRIAVGLSLDKSS